MFRTVAVSKPISHKPLLCVQNKTPDDGQRNCPKHVEFYSQNKFEKLVHLFGFTVRIYHDARSPECQSTYYCRSNSIKRKDVLYKQKTIFIVRASKCYVMECSVDR